MLPNTSVLVLLDRREEIAARRTGAGLTFYAKSYLSETAPVSLVSEPRILENIKPVLARGHDVEPTVSINIGYSEGKPTARAITDGAIINYLLRKRLPVPLEIVDADVIVCPWISSVVCAVTLACHEFAVAVAIDIRPLQIVIL